MLHAKPCLGFLCALLCGIHHSHAASYILTGLVDQRNVLSGEPTYDFFLSLARIFPAPGEEVQLEMISPRGIRLGESSTDVVRADFDGIVPADLDTTVSGAWTIEEIVNGGGLNRYEFTVPQLLNSSNFGPVPVILAPDDGSTVGTVFNLIYSNPSPSSFGYQIIYDDPPPQGSIPTRQINSPGDVTLSFADIPGINGTTVTRFAVHNQVSDLQVLRPKPLNLGANSRFDQLGSLSGLLSFNTNSPAISFTIVPEPTSLVFTILAVVCAPGGRGFLRLQ